MKRLWNMTLTFLALAFLVAFSYPAFIVKISPSTHQVLDLIQWISWVAFAGDLIFNLARTENKVVYLKKHPLEVLAVVLPMFRPLRLLRFVSVGSIAFHRIGMTRSLGITIRVAVVAVFLTYIAAIQVTQIERVIPTGNIKSFSDGLWWALTTVTTVGYGDKFPTTTDGRVLAFGLMIVGISLIGVLTATVAAWFVRMMEVDALKL